LLRLAGLNVVQCDAMPGSPLRDRVTQVLRTVIATYRHRLSPPADDLLQGPDDTRRGQPEADLDSQCFPVEIVDHVEQSDTAAVLQLVVHEIHRPHRIHRRRHDQRLRRLPYQPLARLDAQVQLQLPVNPVHALMVPAEALHVAQVQETQPEAPSYDDCQSAAQANGNLLILRIALPLIAVARLAHAKCLAWKPDRYSPTCYCVPAHLATGRWPQSILLAPLRQFPP
jgi:hypothetical protein